MTLKSRTFGVILGTVFFPLAGYMQWVALKLWLGQVPSKCFIEDRVRLCKDYVPRMHIWDIFVCREKVTLASIFITTDNEEKSIFIYPLAIYFLLNQIKE